MKEKMPSTVQVCDPESKVTADNISKCGTITCGWLCPIGKRICEAIDKTREAISRHLGRRWRNIGWRIPVTECQGVHKEWYEQARNVRTPGQLSAFCKHLTNRYEHDYGTICHAVAAAAVAGAVCINRDKKQGGISGFQSQAVFWEFAKNWMHWDGPMRILRYEEMLYPNCEDSFKRVISASTFKYLQEMSRQSLKEFPKAHPSVTSHWQSICDGKVPFGYEIEGK